MLERTVEGEKDISFNWDRTNIQMTLTVSQERMYFVSLVTEGVPVCALKDILEIAEEK